MAKLRKCLGDLDADYMNTLMRLMETQSKDTLSRWCINYAKDNMLPIYEEIYPEDRCPREALVAAQECLEGRKTIKEVKQIAKEVNAAAKDAQDPIAQAAARSIYAAIGALYTVTNPLGMTFYAAAASAYKSVGLQEKPQVYDRLAADEFERMTDALRAISVENEPNPAKLKWGC